MIEVDVDAQRDVAMTVKLKGRANAATVSEAVGYDATSVLDALVQAGLVEPAKSFFKITPAGVETVSAALAASRRAIGYDALIPIYETFCAVNDSFKTTVTDWQLRLVQGSPVINDHTDEAYDGNVLGRLQSVHARITDVLEQLAAASPRYRRYGERLDAALQRLLAGDRQYMASPAVDSYHSVWFELHEELILLCGLTRAGEAEAGRG